MIRKFKEEDTTRVMALWTKGNFEAHDFIDKDYWLLNYNEVKEKYLKNAETYVYVKDNEIIGFISLYVENFRDKELEENLLIIARIDVIT